MVTPLEFQQLVSGARGPQPPIDVLRKIRGDMWPAIGSPVQKGPRIGQPTNILAMDYYEYEPPEIRRDMRQLYKSYGWTHAVTGPMVDPGGYHGMYHQQVTVPTQAEWDHYLDCMEEWWDDGLIPIHFIHPDGWEISDMPRLEHLYRQSRAHELLRLIVPTGWEPWGYEKKADYWAAMIRQVQAWFAEAPELILSYVHTVSDIDAPTGDGDDFPNGNGGAWDRVAPLIHGWLIQNGPYDKRAWIDPDQTQSFGAQFDFTAAAEHSVAWHFAPPSGHAGWPCVSAWGAGIPLDLIAAEQSAYTKFWMGDRFPEDWARQYGNYALSRGAVGALDGCL